MKPNSLQRRLALLAPLALTLTLSVHAAPVTKAPTGTDLNDDTSWGGTAPTADDTATWTGTSLGAGLTLGTDAVWQGIVVTGAASAIDLSGAGALTLGTAGINTTASNIDLSIANNIALSGSSWWTADTGNTITASGVISGDATLNLGTRGVTLNSYIQGTPTTTTISNTSLSNISTITGQMAGGYVDGDYLSSAAYKYVNNGSTASYQIRLIDGSFTKGVKVTLTQSGADILATVNYAKYTSGANLANDFDTTGDVGTIATSDGGIGYGAARTSLAFAPTADQLGTITLSGNNTFTGGAAVYGGTVKIGHLNAFGTNNRTNPGKIVVASGATVDFNGVGDATYGYTIAGTGVGGNGALVNNGSLIGNGIAQATNIALSADASIGGTGEWHLIAGGYAANNIYLNGNTLTKTGSNTIGMVNTTISSGAVRVSQGTLRLGSAGSGVNGSAAAFTLDSVSGANLNVNLSSSIGSLAGGGATGGNVSIGNSQTLTVGALNTNTSYDGVISGSGGALTKTGTGSLTLTRGSSYTSGTTVAGGTLTTTNNSGFSTGTVTIGTTATDAQLYLANRADVTNAIVVSAAGSGSVVLGASNTGSGADAATYSGAITLNRATTFSGEVASDRLAFEGQISGNVGTLTIQGGSRVTLSNTANNFTGNINITGAGTVLQTSVASAAEVIPNGSSVTVGAGTVLQLASSSGAETINGLNGSGIVRTFSGGSFGSGLVVGSAGGNGNFSGTLENGTSGNPLSLTKMGSGTQELSGTNTYTGNTSITGGTLKLTGSGSLASSNIIVGVNTTFDVSGVTGGYTSGAGQTISGTGTIVGNITVGGTLAPGNSPGDLGFTDNLGLTNTLDLEITGIATGLFDRLVGDGANTLTLGGTLNLNNTGYTAALDDTIIVFTNWQTLTGSFSSITGTDLGGGLSWDTSQLATTGVLTVVPEPRAALLGGVGLLILLRRRRTR
jgi:autotransporter-associated beta strand protein